MRFVRLVAGAGLAFLLVAGCTQSGDRTPRREVTGSQTQAVQNGTVDSTNKFAVGVCFGQQRSTGSGPNGQGCFGTCSGTLVLPNMVITARHCVDDSPDQIICDQNPSFGGPKGSAAPGSTNYFVTTGTQMTPGSAGWHNVKQVLVPQDAHICGNDIAILILNDQVAAAEATPAIPGVQHGMTDRTRYADAYAAIGYGNTSPNGGGSGTRRIKTPNPITCIPGDDEIPCPDLVNDKEFVGGDWICSGDSGSGAFERRSFEAGGPPVSFGVLSRGGESDDETKCIGSIYTRLDKWRDFVVQAAEQASGNWSLYNKPTPDWTVYVPPPPKKDAGTAPPVPVTPPTSKPAGADLGAACSADGDCESQLCIDAADARVCSRLCEQGADLACPDGFACEESHCVVAATAPAADEASTTRKTTTSCAAAPPASDASSSPWAFPFAALAVLGLAAGRRRRS